jgi:PEP-CTERM/exosortase A-associated glycosyltransferase
MSLRILHVLDHSLPLHSGYAFRTAAILREQRALGWETFHLTSPKQGPTAAPEEEIDGFRFSRTPFADEDRSALPVWRELKLVAATKRRLTELASATRPDVIHAHSPALNALPALAVGRRLRVPVVYEVRAFWEDAAVDHGTASDGGLRYRAIRGLETYALRRADHVTTICEGLRKDIVARGIAPERVTVIPNAVDAEEFRFRRPADEALRDRLGLRGATVLGFVGSFYAYEGLDLLIEAAVRLLPEHPALRVLLVGGGPAEGRLRERAEALGLTGRVVFTGRVPNAAVQDYYNLIDVAVYPRRAIRLTELVTPLKPLEAMAQGKLVVASNVGGHRELVRDGETGVLFTAGSADALANAVTGLIRDERRCERLRDNARRFVERERTWRQSVANYVPVFQRLRDTRVGV